MKITHREKNRIKKLHESYRGWNGSLIREDEDKSWMGDEPVEGQAQNQWKPHTPQPGDPYDGKGRGNRALGNLIIKKYQKKNGDMVIKHFFVSRDNPDFKVTLCGISDNFAHLIGNPNGLVEIFWLGMDTPNDGKPNSRCASIVDLQMKEYKEPEKEEVDDWWNNEITESRLKKKVLKEQTGELKGLRELGDYLELLIDKRWISLEIAQRIFDLSVIDVDYLLDNIMDWCEGED